MTDLTYINECRYQQMPHPPIDVINYCKRKLNSPEYSLDIWRRPDMYGWLQDISKWIANNSSNNDWLKELHKDASIAEKASLRTYIDEFDRNKWWLFGKDLIEEVSQYSTVGGV